MLEDEISRQQNNEKLRLQFADQANRVGAWIKEKSSHLIEISIAGHGTLEVCVFTCLLVKSLAK